MKVNGSEVDFVEFLGHPDHGHGEPIYLAKWRSDFPLPEGEVVGIEHYGQEWIGPVESATPLIKGMGWEMAAKVELDFDPRPEFEPEPIPGMIRELARQVAAHLAVEEYTVEWTGPEQVAVTLRMPLRDKFIEVTIVPPG